MPNYVFDENTLLPIAANYSYGELTDKQLKTLSTRVESACADLLTALGIDIANDPNSKDTPKRMAKMYISELLRGRYQAIPECREFPNQQAFDQLYTVGPIPITSLCSHHFLPFTGHCYIGILPDTNKPVLGLSKFARLAEWVFARPQIQEEATIQLADLLEQKCQPRGLGVVVSATHQCMVLRGVKADGAKMTTSVLRGLLRSDPMLRSEFLTLVRGAF